MALKVNWAHSNQAAGAFVLTTAAQHMQFSGKRPSGSHLAGGLNPVGRIAVKALT